jgi:hypothetical protein
MLKKGVIQRSRSAWQSPVLLVKKSDGTWRFVVDFRAVNQKTPIKGGRIPLIIDTLDALQGAKFFSYLDLQAGYWHMPIAEPDGEKTAFLLYAFKNLFQILYMAWKLLT